MRYRPRSSRVLVCGTGFGVARLHRYGRPVRFVTMTRPHEPSKDGAFDPYAERHAPPWLNHLRTEHTELFWVSRSMLVFRDRYLRWPARNELFVRCRNRYADAAEMEHAIDTLNTAWDVRELMECDRRCGHPVYRFSMKNPRGPRTIRYGLNPFPSVIDTELKMPLVRGALAPEMCGDNEVTAWREVIASKRAFEPEFQPDRDIKWILKRIEVKGS